MIKKTLAQFSTYTLGLLVFASSILDVPAQEAPVSRPLISYEHLFHPVVGTSGMVSSQEARATQIGVDVLEIGGNAIDAAVAVGYALAVTLPKAGNLGGGGFMLVYSAEDRKCHALDFREMAPLASKPDLFLDQPPFSPL